METLKGIDISNHNHDYLRSRDYYDILAADFVMMKASEGLTYKDTLLDHYYDVLHGSNDGQPDSEKLYGFYHYARPEKHTSPIAEARHFLSLVSHHAGNCVYALDVEQDALKCADKYLNAWVLIWLDYVYKNTGVRPLVYCSAAETGRFYGAAAADYGLWCASWGKRPTKKMIAPWSVCAMWQNSTTNGHLDTDVFYGNADQFRKYCERC